MGTGTLVRAAPHKMPDPVCSGVGCATQDARPRVLRCRLRDTRCQTPCAPVSAARHKMPDPVCSVCFVLMQGEEEQLEGVVEAWKTVVVGKASADDDVRFSDKVITEGEVRE